MSASDFETTKTSNFRFKEIVVKEYSYQVQSGGVRGQPVEVLEKNDGKERSYSLFHIIRHSPDGFNFGYGGSGPADLALSMLTDAVGKTLAERWYQQFKFEVIAGLPRDNSWVITENQIFGWLKEKGEEI